MRRPRRGSPIAAAALRSVAFAAAMLAVASPAQARRDAAPPAWPGSSVVVGYVSDAALKQALGRSPARILRQLPALHAVEVKPRGNPAAFAAVVAASPGIEYAEPPAARHSFAEPALAPAAVPGGAYQWQYTVTRADQVPVRVSRSALTVTVAVVDSGADVTAPDLAAKRPLTYNAMDSSSDVRDTVGHGTFVASLAAGSSTNGEGIAGMGGEARLMVAKASTEGLFTDFDMAAAIIRAVDYGAKVVNLSLGGPRSTTTEVRALRYAAAKDVLLVAAVGNEYLRGNPVEYPAAHLQPVGSNGQGGMGLAVGASTISGARAEFSNTGSQVSLAAPGQDVFGAISKDSSPKFYPRTSLPGSSAGLYGYGSGTSYAAPQVAGAAALVWGANRLLSARQVAEILKQTASGHGSWNPELGFGVIDVAAAVELARTTPAVTLRAFRSGTKAYLNWRGAPAKSYRLLVRVGDGPARVVLDATTQMSYTFEGASGRTHVFEVESLDASGAVVARSAPAIVTLGQSPATLRLRAFRFKQKRKRHVVLLALLEPKAIDVRGGSRMIMLEERVGGRWRLVAYQFTDAGGRVAWFVPPGTHTIRARFGGSLDVAAAQSRPLTVRG